MKIAKIRKAAQGAPCMMRAKCGGHPHDPTVVYCHLNYSWAGKGMGKKAHDIAGFFGCYNCHKWVDEGQKGDDMMVWLFPAVVRTWMYLLDKGVLK